MTPLLPIAILGSGGHARVVADACLEAGISLAGFVGPAAAAGEQRAGLALLGNDELLSDSAFLARNRLFVAIGDQLVRQRLTREIRERGGDLATIVHPRAVLAADVRLGVGTVVLAGAVINTGAVIGDSVIVHSNATIDHDTRLEEGVQICPGVNLAGDVVCQRLAYVGTGASVIRGCEIGERATVGAGTVVISDVAPGVTVAGSPARTLHGDS